MKDTTTDYLIHLLKKDSIIKKRDFSKENIDEELLTSLRTKINKKYKTIRVILALVLFLILATFIYISIEDNITNFAKYIIRFWYIYLGAFIANVFISKEIWNSKRNLLILDLFKKELLNK